MRLSIVALLMATLVVTLSATAEESAPVQESIVVRSQSPTLATPAESGEIAPTSELAPAPAEGAIVTDAPIAACCPVEVVDSRVRLSARRLLRCQVAPVNLNVCVENPACRGKLSSVPLCVPCCCQSAARVCNPHCGLLGRGKVDLVWNCGFTATVTFLASGDAVVTYHAS